MSAPKNIQRDGTYLNPQNARIGASISADITAPTGNSTGSVNVDVGFVQYNYGAPISLTAGQVASFGVLMKPPEKDRHPYRIKIHAGITDGSVLDENPEIGLVIGYAPATPTGTDDAIESAAYFPIAGNQFDELFIIEDLDILDPLLDRALYFGIVVVGPVTAGNLYAHLSVQNLGVKPPTMQNAVS